MGKKEAMTAEEYSAELADLAERIKSNGFQRYWERPCDYSRWSCSGNYSGKEYWQIVTALPPLIAAAELYGRPSSGAGKWMWGIVAPELWEQIFGAELDRFVLQMREMVNGDIDRWYFSEGRRLEEYEDRILAYRRLKEFVGLMEAAGVTRYRTRLTDHGMSAAEISQLEKFVDEKSAEIEGIRNAPCKPLLF